MLKRIIPLVLVLLILAVSVAYLLSTERQESNNLQELYRQTEPLQRQKDELVARKAELEENFRIETRDISTVQILFRESNVKLFTQVYPLLRERGITAVIGFSLDDYPGVGTKDKISLEHYNRLIMDGWGSCLVYDGNMTLDSYLLSMKTRLDRTGVAMPTTIFFSGKKNPYDPSMDDLLREFGLDTIVRNAADGRSETVTQVEELWRTGAMPWNYTGIRTDLELLAATEGGNLTLTASFDDIWDGMMNEVPATTNNRNPVEPTVQDAFVDFLDMIADMDMNETSLLNATPTPGRTPTPDPNSILGETELLLKTTDFPSARQTHLDAQTSTENSYAEYDRMQAELDAEIARLEKQIADVYTAFNIKQATTDASLSGETA